MEHIIKFENDPKFTPDIIRKLSMYDQNVPKYENKGLAICHGHNYSIRTLANVEIVDYWYMIDRYMNAFPDYRADAANKLEMSYFPDNYFDCVLTVYCPVINDIYIKELQYSTILINIHRILKKNGTLILTELPLLFFHFISDDEFKNIISQIKKIVSEKDIQEFKTNYINNIIKPALYETMNEMKNRLNSKKNLSPEIQLFLDEINTEEGFKKHLTNRLNRERADDTDVYREMLAGNYNGPNSDVLLQRIKEISIPHTKKLLKDNGFEMIEIKNDLLFAKPI